jgi:hypothetical protein
MNNSGFVSTNPEAPGDFLAFPACVIMMNLLFAGKYGGKRREAVRVVTLTASRGVSSKWCY